MGSCGWPVAIECQALRRRGNGPCGAYGGALATRNAVVMRRYILAPRDGSRLIRDARGGPRCASSGTAERRQRAGFPCFGHTWPLPSVTARAGVQSRGCRDSCVVSHPPEAWTDACRRGDVRRFAWRGRRGSRMRLETDRASPAPTRPADSAFGSSRRLSAPEVNVETRLFATARGRRRACRAAHGPV
jgi:hypothetical protein